jgi:hypothetical protein
VIDDIEDDRKDIIVRLDPRLAARGTTTRQIQIEATPAGTIDEQRLEVVRWYLPGSGQPGSTKSGRPSPNAW